MSRTMKRNLKEQIYLLPWNIDLVDFAEVDQQFAQEALKDTIEIS